MPNFLGRAADRLLTRFVPRMTAAAGAYCNRWYFCYCSYGLAYRKYYTCGGPSGRMSSCQPSGTC